MSTVEEWKARFDADGYDTTLLAGPCCICGENLDHYQTKMVNPETKQVACGKHPEVHRGGSLSGFKRYSDG